jgi:7-cyano-7-deazaguanine reductase
MSKKNNTLKKTTGYTDDHAASGLDTKFPDIETWPNQFKAYEILIDDPEFTSVCPKTGLPDFGRLTIRYMPRKRCMELKSLKEYLFTYRNLGIFQENIVNQVLDDVVKATDPVWAKVVGDFRPRGGISTVVEAFYPRPQDSKGPRG